MSAVRRAFTDQAGHCAALGSPFMARLMTLAAERLAPGTPVADAVLDWPGDPSVNRDSVPLRLAGALHALRLDGLALADVYPPAEVDDDTLWRGVERAMEDHAARLMDWLTRPPQTNEVRRAAVILPALAMLQEQFNLPVDLLELGTSGGLNLRADLFRLTLPGGTIGPEASPVVLTPDWQGPMPPTLLPRIVRRAGVDLTPLDPADPDGEARLLAYLWADQPDRIERTRAAIGLARDTPAEVSSGDAGDWLERELAEPVPDRLRVVLHTVAWQYFPKATQARTVAAMANASGPLARIAMENDGGDGASVTLTTWPDSVPRQIARADFHGRWVRWTGA